MRVFSIVENEGGPRNLQSIVSLPNERVAGLTPVSRMKGRVEYHRVGWYRKKTRTLIHLIYDGLASAVENADTEFVTEPAMVGLYQTK